MNGVTPERLEEARAQVGRLEASIRVFYIGQDDLLKDVLTGLVADHRVSHAQK